MICSRVRARYVKRAFFTERDTVRLGRKRPDVPPGRRHRNSPRNYVNERCLRRALTRAYQTRTFRDQTRSLARPVVALDECGLIGGRGL
jgi:hypothetical protein